MHKKIKFAFILVALFGIGVALYVWHSNPKAERPAGPIQEAWNFTWKEGSGADSDQTPDISYTANVQSELLPLTSSRRQLNVQIMLKNMIKAENHTWIASWVFDTQLRTVSLSMPPSIDRQGRQIMETLLRTIPVTPRMMEDLQKNRLEMTFFGPATIQFTQPDKITLVKEKTWQAPDQQTLLSGSTTWTFAKDGGIQEAKGRESVERRDAGTATEKRMTHFTLLRAETPAGAVSVPVDLALYDGFSDPRILWQDRRPAWEQRLKDSNIPDALQKLKAQKIAPEDKVTLTQELEAWLSLHPEEIPQLVEIMLAAQPGDDSFHMAAIILAKLRLTQVNSTFVELADRLQAQPELLNDLALYFNDLDFPDSKVFSKARDLSEGLSTKSGVRFALALGTMTGKTENQNLKESHRLYLENKVEQAKDTRDRQIWLSALGNAGSEESLPLIKGYLQNPDEAVVLVAINALRKYSWVQIREPVFSILAKGVEYEALQLIKVLGEIRPSENDRPQILEALSRFPSEAVRKRLPGLELGWKSL